MGWIVAAVALYALWVLLFLGLVGIGFSMGGSGKSPAERRRTAAHMLLVGLTFPVWGPISLLLAMLGIRIPRR